MIRPRTPFLLVVVALAACSSESSDLLGPGAASLDHSASHSLVVVTESDVTRQAEGTAPTDSWVLYTRAGTPASAGAFAAGPDTPPLGAGSFQTTTATPGEKVFLFNFDYAGTALASISALGYSTYQAAATNPVQLPALNVVVDYNGAAEGGFTTLVYEPVYNVDDGPIVSGVWQDWNALEGRWWSTRAIPGVCAFDCFVEWSAIVAANPDAVVLAGVGINQGSGNGGLSGATDALTIGVGATSVTYDFEAFRVATTMEQCKDGGWQTVKTADGDSFPNQGQCVAYTNGV